MPGSNLLRDQFTATILQIFRTNGMVLGWGDRFSAGFGLTSARWQMLGALAMAPQPLTAPQIAINMGMSRQGAQKQLNVLADEALIEKQHNPYHKRPPLYRLTPEGQTLFDRIDTNWKLHAEQIGQEFSVKELTTTMQVLSRIQEIHQSPVEGITS